MAINFTDYWGSFHLNVGYTLAKRKPVEQKLELLVISLPCSEPMKLIFLIQTNLYPNLDETQLAMQSSKECVHSQLSGNTSYKDGSKNRKGKDHLFRTFLLESILGNSGHD